MHRKKCFKKTFSQIVLFTDYTSIPPCIFFYNQKMNEQIVVNSAAAFYFQRIKMINSSCTLGKEFDLPVKGLLYLKQFHIFCITHLHKRNKMLIYKYYY